MRRFWHEFVYLKVLIGVCYLEKVLREVFYWRRFWRSWFTWESVERSFLLEKVLTGVGKLEKVLREIFYRRRFWQELVYLRKFWQKFVYLNQIVNPVFYTVHCSGLHIKVNSIIVILSVFYCMQTVNKGLFRGQ